jgi:hypothetical protein
MLVTIAELPQYIKRSSELLDVSERKSLIDYLSMHPRAGDLMEGTGGIRKIRWGRANRGKSSGVRVIYYFHDERLPLFLLTMFGKNEQANLSKAERNELVKLVDILVEVGLRGHHG